MNRRHSNGVLQVILLVCMLIATTFSRADDSALVQHLERINTMLVSQHTPYRLRHDEDFPCSITLTEVLEQGTDRWVKRYVVELSDLSPGKLISSRDGRRAISYYGQKTTANGKTTDFAPKKIGAIQVHTSIAGNQRTTLQQQLDLAIGVCAEKNRF